MVFNLIRPLFKFAISILTKTFFIKVDLIKEWWKY